MAYRGEDLDLRTPQSWNPPPADAPGSADPYVNGSRGRPASYGRQSQPILVDDVVLACCNHAFDVAVAHRASEVRLEHLLHAMTRVDGASNALEARGIRVSGLRRESATIIAGEIPIGVGAGQNRPRRSDDLEAVLRSASGIAYRRNGPANVDDILDALLDMPADLPGIALLARHGARIARDRTRQRHGRDPLSLQPLPPLTRPQAGYTETRGADYPLEPARERLAAGGSSYLVNDLNRPPRGAELLGTPTDSIQNARLDQLETVIRTLAADLAGERTEHSRFRGGLHDRLQSIEQAVSNPDSSPDAGLLLDRLSAVEGRLEQRLNELSRPWSVLSDRLQALEQTILDTSTQSSPDLGGLHDRFAGLERVVRETSNDSLRSQSGLADRLKQSIDLGPIASRLDIIEEAVLSNDGSKANQAILERLKALEDSLTNGRSTTSQSIQTLTADVRSLASTLAAQAAHTEQSHALVSDRLQMMSSSLERQRADAPSLASRLDLLSSSLETQTQSTIAPLVERMTGLITSLDARLATATAPLAARIADLEAKLAASAQANAEAQAAHNAELKEVHDALIKLNTNQHTLAGSIDQWRLDGVGDISVIAKQLETIEKSSAKPVAMIETLTASVDNISKVTAERYHRRNRLLYWMFGTDDWLTASWPSQVSSVDAERAHLTAANLPSVKRPVSGSRPAQR